MSTKFLDQFSSPASKLVRFFKNGRDKVKVKRAELRKKCKKLENQTRAVEKSRAQWRERTRTAARRTAELEREIEDLKCRREPAACR